jgi:dihydrodipicolinate synthase/N-acetylneuraminate lyase
MPVAGGMTVATLTPYDSAGRVDLGTASAHAQWLVEQGIPVLAPVGTTGEALYLERAEKQQLIRAAVEAAAGRASVIAGIWALRLEEIRDLHMTAADAGADGVFLTSPIYYPSTDDSVVAFYDSVHGCGPLPVYAYNIPQYTANEVSLEALDRLTQSGAIAGVKDSTGKVDRLEALLSRFSGRLTIFAASDGMALKARRMGADGFISALANIYPRTLLRIWERGSREEDQEAIAAQALVDRLRAAVKSYGGIAGLKHMLAHRGFPSQGTRLPFQELDEGARVGLDRVLDELGELD